jgi:hypothetical protein
LGQFYTMKAILKHTRGRCPRFAGTSPFNPALEGNTSPSFPPQDEAGSPLPTGWTLSRVPAVPFPFQGRGTGLEALVDFPQPKASGFHS